MILASALAISAGTYSGGFRIIRTLGPAGHPADAGRRLRRPDGRLRRHDRDRDRVRRPGLHDAHHDHLDHGRGRDPAAVGGPLGRRGQHRPGVDRHPAGRRPRSPRWPTSSPTPSSADRRDRRAGQRQPVALGTPAGRWLVAVTVLASGMAFLDATAVQVALPSIGRDLGASLSGLQWTVTGYTLTLASLILLGGSLGDRYGRRKVFVIGVVLVRRRLADLRAGPEHRAARRRPAAAGHRRRAAHPGQPGADPVLVPARGPRPRDRPVVVAGRHRRADRARSWAACWSTRVSWRLVFLLNVPFAVVIVAVAGRHVPESRDPAAHGRFDSPGRCSGALALGGVTYALIGAGREPAARRRRGRRCVLGVAAAAAFVVRERRAADPMLPLAAVRRPAVHRRQPGDARRLRGARRQRAVPRAPAADDARLRRHRGRRRHAALDRADHAALAAHGDAGHPDRPPAADDRRAR